MQRNADPLISPPVRASKFTVKNEPCTIPLLAGGFLLHFSVIFPRYTPLHTSWTRMACLY